MIPVISSSTPGAARVTIRDDAEPVLDVLTRSEAETEKVEAAVWSAMRQRTADPDRSCAAAIANVRAGGRQRFVFADWVGPHLEAIAEEVSRVIDTAVVPAVAPVIGPEPVGVPVIGGPLSGEAPAAVIGNDPAPAPVNGGQTPALPPTWDADPPAVPVIGAPTPALPPTWDADPPAVPVIGGAGQAGAPPAPVVAPETSDEVAWLRRRNAQLEAALASVAEVVGVALPVTPR